MDPLTVDTPAPTESGSESTLGFELMEIVQRITRSRAVAEGRDSEVVTDKDLLLACISIARATIRGSAACVAHSHGAADQGQSLYPGFARFVGLALLNDARDVETHIRQMMKEAPGAPTH